MPAAISHKTVIQLTDVLLLKMRMIYLREKERERESANERERRLWSLASEGSPQCLCISASLNGQSPFSQQQNTTTTNSDHDDDDKSLTKSL